jgi:hypothetical protein
VTRPTSDRAAAPAHNAADACCFLSTSLKQPETKIGCIEFAGRNTSINTGVADHPECDVMQRCGSTTGFELNLAEPGYPVT